MPALGSGGFLIATYEDVYKHALSNGIEPAKKEKLLKRLGQNTFFAAEIEEKAARLGKVEYDHPCGGSAQCQLASPELYIQRGFGGLKPQIEYEVDFGSGKTKTANRPKQY